MVNSCGHLGVFLALALCIGPGQETKAEASGQPCLRELAQKRFDAANKLYETAWSYYRQKATSTAFVFFTSARLLRAELDLCEKRENAIAAYEHHLCRLKRLQSLLSKVQALGRANTLEASEMSLYLAEAEYWLALARNGSETQKPRDESSPLIGRSRKGPDPEI
jgi:hypothetical protein